MHPSARSLPPVHRPPGHARHHFVAAFVARCAVALSLLGLLPSGHAATVVKLGSVRTFSSPADLDLEGDLAYAINFSADDPRRTVRGWVFVPDTLPIPGATLVGPQTVTGWQNRPEFGSGTDATQLEEILHDIRWANSGSGERLRASLAVTPGDEYKLQVLISGNGPEERRWDIRVNGREAVDEISSLGVVPGAAYAPNRSVVFTYEFVAPSAIATVEMGDLFGRRDGGDRNPIWQALTLERITQPPTPDDLVLDAPRLFPHHQGPVGRFRIVDRKSNATHALTFVSGPGDNDNTRFALDGSDLLPGAFDFSLSPPGTAFSVRLRASDTAVPERFIEKTFTIRLLEAHAPTAIRLDATSVSERATPGALVARLATDDPDPFDRSTFEQLDLPGTAAQDVLGVAGDTLTLVRTPPPGARSLQVRIRATDQSGLSTESTLTLPVLPPRLRLNELMATRIGGVLDEASEPTEWVELLNDSGQYEDPAGWFLSDSGENLRKWAFPSRPMAPGRFLVVLADGTGVTPEGSTNLHAGLSLSADGEWLGLIRPDGTTLADALPFPAQFPGVAYGIGDSGKPGFLPAPTPGATNGAIAPRGENAVAFSRTRGFVSETFPLELTASIPGSTIRYTLDGSLPSATSGIVYTGAIPITPASGAATRGIRIVRALALHPDAAFARVATHTYLFIRGAPGTPSEAVTNQSRLLSSIVRHPTYGPLLDDALLALPALAVTMPQSPTPTERRASIELIDPEQREPGFQIECGIAATGTTSLGSPKLSMAARFRSEYGRSRLVYPVYAHGSLVPAGAATEFKELRLRSHSHDTFYWLGTRENPPVPYGSPPVNRSGDAQLARNLWIEETQLRMGQPGKHGRQVHLFLNGSYHGIYHIQEHADHDFMASYFPGSDEDFHFTGAAITGSDHHRIDTWRTPWNSLKASLGNYTEARRWIDVTNLCDYMILSFYAGNDWDWSSQHNWSAAGPKAPDRGGWKFFQQDSDVALQDVAANCTDQDVPDGIFSALMRFADFKTLFRDRIQKHCFGNGVLTPASAGAFYDTRMREISTAIIAETARWQPSSSIAALPWDRDQEWTNEWRYLRDTFFPQRTDRLLQQIRQRSGWWPADAPAFSPAPGEVPAGSALRITATAGTVYFTTDGSDPRLPGGGVHPSAQSVGGTSPLRTLIPSGATWRFLDTGVPPAPAWSSPEFQDADWKSGPAEIGYGDGNEVTTAGFVDTDPAVDGVQKNITTWFRYRFATPDPAALGQFRLRILCDDGAVVHLNGKELIRINMLDGPVTPETRAIASVGGADESAFAEFELPATGPLLRAEGNVLAVEVHQNSPESSDISFDLELTAQAATPPAGSSLVLRDPMQVRARTRIGSEWSALNEGYFVPQGFPKPTATNVFLTEIHYHPALDPETEFLEFFNASPNGVDLSGCTLQEAVDFEFPVASLLPAGGRLVVARNPAAFDALYSAPESPFFRPGIRRLGPWTGALSNGGETLRVHAPDGSLIFQCAYRTETPWPTTPDGEGPSLEWSGTFPTQPSPAEATALLADARGWSASTAIHGTPGFARGTAAPSAYDVWARSVFPANAPPDRTRPEADFDGDGLSNLEEFAFALSPVTPDAPPLRVARDPLQSGLQLDYQVRAEPAPFSYRVESSIDLLNWTANPAGLVEVSRETTSTGGVRIRAAIAAENALLFLRIRAVPKP